ncbi:MAG: glycosyltransferase family 1 protein [Bryobacteraceae bacterium]
MRVSIDATPLLLRSAGVKTYFYHWLRHLARVESPIHLDLFPRLHGLGALDHESSHYGYFATRWRLGLLLAANRGIPPARWILMPRRTDLFHVSNQMRRPARNIPLSATVHDFTCWLMPELHTEANVRADRHFADAVLARAAGLIAVSENTRRDAIRVLGIDAGRVEVIYPGVSEAYFRAGATREGTAPDAQSSQTTTDGEKPYVLFVGTIEPRKNVGVLMDAFAMLPASIREHYELKIAGPPGWGSAELMRRLAAPPAGVRYLGYVPEDEAPALFAGASLVAYPSLYEGFGFPVAQALACGVPVLTSSVSSLPEVGGPGAQLVDPRSAAEIRDGLLALLTSPSRRAALSGAGAAHAQRLFRWDENARRSLAFFHKAGGRA